MSHDRGCFICHEDRSEYANCKRADCPKRPGPIRRTERAKGVVEVGGELREHDGRALGRRLTQADLDAATLLPPLGDSRRGRVTRIISVTEPGYDIALFMNEDGGAEAVITRPGLSPTGVNIAPPAPGRRIVIERTGQRFEVVYKDVPK